jgi:hypothetical protein
MDYYLYAVRLSMGSSNNNFSTFLVNVSDMSAEPTDRGGITSLCVIRSWDSAENVKTRCIRNFKGKSAAKDVTVEEITDATLNDSDHLHSQFWDVWERLRNRGPYPHLAES